MARQKARTERMDLDCVAEIAHKPLGDKGEDAFAYSYGKDGLHLQAVFDGCGGSGSWQYAEFGNATGAFVAAQRMAGKALEWFSGLSAADAADAGKLGQSFHDTARQALAELKDSCAPMRVSGSLVRAFPCTASIAVVREYGEDLLLTTLNTGDSRVYVLTPESGLVQVTTDDSEGDPDPMESLRDSAPLSAMLSGDRDFTVRTRQIAVPRPCAILCATDGMFGYLRSPMDFEYLLLDTLEQAESFAGFEELLQERVAKVTGDDSTCIASFYGWGSYGSVKRKLRGRYGYIASVARALDEAQEAGRIEEALEEVWKGYRKQTLLNET